MKTCIYCLENSNHIPFTKTEHVLPQSFGKFKNNFTLNNIVCDKCNQFFGNILEIHLARDTREGNYRFEFGIKENADYKKAGAKSRQLIQIDEGFYKGAYAYKSYSKKEQKILLSPRNQVGFLKKNNNGYIFFLNDEIPNPRDLDTYDVDLSQPSAIIILPDHNKKALEILKEKGINCNRTNNDSLEESIYRQTLCKVEYTVDQIIFRAIAKISFNYLAYWQNIDFILLPAFNIIRKFIRYGEKPTYPIVVPTNKPILGDEREEGTRRLGHILTTNWAKNNVSIIGKVALFNDITYLVSLALNLTDQRTNISKGHFFNITDRTIFDLSL